MLLNSLLGRFGMDITRAITKLVNENDYSEIATTHVMKGEIDITKQMKLVTYVPEISQKVCDSFGIDVTKATLKYKDKYSVETNSYNNVSVAISAAVTAYGRIHISKLKNLILDLGGKLFYSDTDSIVTDIKLPENLVDNQEIGKVKLEHKLVKRGYFISGKTYLLVLDNDKVIIKAKGVSSKSLNEDHYIKMLNGFEVQDAIRPQSSKFYEEGYVKIWDKGITLNPNSYTKRTKIFDSDKHWVDTKPLVLESNLFSLIFTSLKWLFRCVGIMLLFIILLTIKYLFIGEDDISEDNDGLSDLELFWLVSKKSEAGVEQSPNEQDVLTKVENKQSYDNCNKYLAKTNKEENSPSFSDMESHTVENSKLNTYNQPQQLENTIFDVMVHNMEAVMANRGITVLEGNTQNIDLDKIKQLLSEMEISASSSPDNSSFDGDINTDIVKQIRSGNQVHIFTEGSDYLSSISKYF